MSWVLVAWDGAVPAGAADAARMFEELEASVPEDDPPTAGIQGYVEELLAHWPDITEDAGEDSPWGDGPLINNASGPLFVFSLVTSSLDESIPYCTDVARRRGIVLYDPEQEELYSPAGLPPAPSKPQRRFFRRR